MASTAISGRPINIVGTSLQAGTAGARKLAYGVATLAGGALELNTGLNVVEAIFINGLNTTDTFSVTEDSPMTGTEITIAGTGTDQFCWLAIGY